MFLSRKKKQKLFLIYDRDGKENNSTIVNKYYIFKEVGKQYTTINLYVV